MNAPPPDRRGNSRHMIQLKVEYNRLNTFFQDYTCNISQGGMFIKTEKQLPVGSSFELKLIVPELPKPLELKCEVRWVVKSGDVMDNAPSQSPGMGIRFVYDSDDDRRQIEIMVEWLMKKHLGERIYHNLLHR